MGSLLDIGGGNDFINMTLKAQSTKPKINKLKSFCTAKETVNKERNKLQSGQRTQVDIFQKKMTNWYMERCSM
jgi:tRNA1(Val) A37 N6-methylase TrmN6